MFAFVVYKLGAFLAKSMSLPTARRTANVVGRLMCFLQRRNRRILLRNLEIAFGHERSPEELKRLRRAIFQNFAVFVTDFLRLPLVNRDSLSDYLTEGSLETMERLGRIPTSASPVISITAHLGNWELGAAATGLLAGPISDLISIQIWYILGGLLTADFGIGGFFSKSLMSLEENNQGRMAAQASD